MANQLGYRSKTPLAQRDILVGLLNRLSYINADPFSVEEAIKDTLRGSHTGKTALEMLELEMGSLSRKLEQQQMVELKRLFKNSKSILFIISKMTELEESINREVSEAVVVNDISVFIAWPPIDFNQIEARIKALEKIPESFSNQIKQPIIAKLQSIREKVKGSKVLYEKVLEPIDNLVNTYQMEMDRRKPSRILSFSRKTPEPRTHEDRKHQLSFLRVMLARIVTEIRDIETAKKAMAGTLWILKQQLNEKGQKGISGSSLEKKIDQALLKLGYDKKHPVPKEAIRLGLDQVDALTPEQREAIGTPEYREKLFVTELRLNVLNYSSAHAKDLEENVNGIDMPGASITQEQQKSLSDALRESGLSFSIKENTAKSGGKQQGIQFTLKIVDSKKFKDAIKPFTEQLQAKSQITPGTRRH